MITSILSGGLGNQIFQYSAARALSIHLNTGLILDISSFSTTTHSTNREYELDIFGIHNIKNKNIPTQLLLKLLPKLKTTSQWKSFLKLMNLFSDKKAQLFYPEFYRLPDGCTICGYFQNENYFMDIENQLRKDLTFKTPLNNKSLEIKNIINSCNSVSIHIRRSDYLHKNSNLVFPGINYISQAIEIIKTNILKPVFFIFSDDMEWVKATVDLSPYTYYLIDWNNGKESYMDMQLMSLCQHNIIANSSFSWWGAWLNNNKNKLVIAPDRWYKTDIPNSYPDGAIPKSWIII